MTRLRYILAVILCPVFLTACTDVDEVLFVTSTQVGIDVDPKKRGASIGYDRYEGYIGPVYETGAAPPVFARMQSSLGFVSPKVRQVYATGPAAVQATNGNVPPSTTDRRKLMGKREKMFFGTGTTIGLNGTIGKNLNTSLGFKRFEFSIIPIMKPKNSEEDTYAPVLATIALDGDIKSNRGNLEDGFEVDQFFATGEAAENLAAKPAIRRLFEKEAIEGLQSRQITCTDSSEAKTSPETQKIQAWLNKNPKAHEAQLRVFIDQEIVEHVTFDELLNCKEYEESKKRIIETYGISAGVGSSVGRKPLPDPNETEDP